MSESTKHPNDAPSTKRRASASGKRNSKALSHSMSWALRHAAPELGLSMTSDGYVPVDDLLNCGHRKFESFTEEDVQRVVETSDKQRFKLCDRPATEFGRKDDESTILCVRANQGHSIPNIDPEKLLKRVLPEELQAIPIIVHGTFWDAWRGGIEKQGLSRMTRNHIHFASGMPREDHVISGMRKSCTVFVFVDGKRCADEGVEFFLSDNGVLLTAGVNNEGILPARFFKKVVSRSGDVLLDNGRVGKRDDYLY